MSRLVEGVHVVVRWVQQLGRRRRAGRRYCAQLVKRHPRAQGILSHPERVVITPTPSPTNPSRHLQPSGKHCAFLWHLGWQLAAMSTAGVATADSRLPSTATCPDGLPTVALNEALFGAGSPLHVTIKKTAIAREKNLRGRPCEERQHRYRLIAREAGCSCEL